VNVPFSFDKEFKSVLQNVRQISLQKENYVLQKLKYKNVALLLVTDYHLTALSILGSQFLQIRYSSLSQASYLLANQTSLPIKRHN
jgi:3-deoxy-D-manno-octulosonic acid (KDO) 8-phosphate synthase